MAVRETLILWRAMSPGSSLIHFAPHNRDACECKHRVPNGNTLKVAAPELGSESWGRSDDHGTRLDSSGFLRHASSTVFHIAAPDISETLYRAFLDSTNQSQALAYIGVGGMLATAVFTVSVITIPMIVDQGASVGQAMRGSVHAVLRNIPAMILWSALILVATIIGYAPLLAGMVIIAPLLVHATRYAYADMVVQPARLRTAKVASMIR